MNALNSTFFDAEWLSVLKYDREYRRKQANSGRPWGSDMPVLRDVVLVPKGQAYINGTQNSRKTNKGNNGKSYRRDFKRKTDLGEKMKICRCEIVL